MSAALLLRRRGAALQLRALLSWGRVSTGATCLREAAACAAAPPQLRSVHAAAASLGSSAHSTAAPGVLSVQQTRVAAAIRRALSTALNSGALASRFMQGSGFSVLEVRMTPDLRRAYIRWDAVPGQLERTERELARSAVPLRNAVAKLVGLKHTPELHFRRNVILQEQSQLEDVWQAIKLERQLDGEDDEDSDYESEEEEEPPAEPPRFVPL